MIVALRNQKGRVGKTTMALRLAREWARQGLRVIVIDADPQGQIENCWPGWSEQRAKQGLPRLVGVIGLARGTLHRVASEIVHTVDQFVIDAPPRVAAGTRAASLADGCRDAARAARKSFQIAWSQVR